MIRFFLVWLLLVANVDVLAINIQAKSWLIADESGNIIESENIDIVQHLVLNVTRKK